MGHTNKQTSKNRNRLNRPWGRYSNNIYLEIFILNIPKVIIQKMLKVKNLRENVSFQCELGNLDPLDSPNESLLSKPTFPNLLGKDKT